MKRIVSLLLVAVLAVVAVPASLLSAFALETTQISPAVAEDMKVSYTGDSDKDGFQVAINASLADGIESFAAYDVTVSWDSSVLALATDGISFAEGASADRSVNTQEGSVTVVSASATDYITDGALFTATFYPLKALVTAEITVTVESVATAAGLIDAVGGSVSVPVLQQLPENASTIMYAGCYYDVGVSIILAGDNKTVTELTTQTLGQAKDLNAFALFVVDADNIVTETYLTYGRPDGDKSNVTCPVGGYIIGYHQNLTPPDVKVGDVITLYNIDLDAVRSATSSWALTDAGFTYAAPNTQVTVNVNENAVLTDGVSDVTESWFNGANGKSVLVANTNCKNAGMDVTVLYALDETKKINGVSLSFFHEAVTMIGYPEGKATVLVSTDGENYTEVGKFELVNAGLSTNSYGTVKNEFGFDAVEAAYVKVLFTVGSNAEVLGETPSDGKIFWEFVALTEVTVDEYTHEHSYTAVVTAPTLSKTGYTTYTCECGDTYTSDVVPAVKAQPDTLVSLPDGAIAIDYAGYKHDAYVSIVAGDNLTVSDLTALGNNGIAKDMNYAYIIVVDASNAVVAVNCGMQVSKADVECPEGGYIISYNCNKAGYDVMTGIEVGDIITLYNIDVEAMRGVADNAVLTDAGFTYAAPKTHEHSYTAVVTAPTLSKDGYTTYTCECGDTYTSDVVPAVKAQPDTLVSLPDGAIAIDYAGYKHDAYVSIVAGDNLTVSDLTALGNNGIAKDMNYAYIIVVDASNAVVAVNCGMQVSKADVECPEGGYIISYNCNKAGYDVMTGIEVGDIITLYNIDLEAMRGVADNAVLTDAGFTFAALTPVEKTVETNGIDVLSQENPDVDADWGAGASADNVYLIQNDACTEVGMIVTLLHDLGETEKIDGVTLSFYHNAGVMIGYPEGQATVLVSTDGENYTEIGTFDFAEAVLIQGDFGTVTSEFTFEAVEAAYVKVVFEVGSNEAVLGDSPSDGKAYWEFVGLTQFKVEEAADEFVRGDINGNGEIDAKDYMILKRHILETYTMTDEEYARADVDLNGVVEAKDYIMLKRVYLGTYSFTEGSLV